MSKINNIMLKDLKESTKIDPDTGKYVNAQKVGRNISIGIVIIFAGILYAMGGLILVITAIVTCMVLLFVSALVMYILVKSKVI